MYHYIYQITNNIDGKIYIGKHSTKNLKDGYFGSGTDIRIAVKELGKENFSFDILFHAFSEDYAYEIEAEIVNSEFLSREDTYNMILGGRGTFSGQSNPFFGRKHSEETLLKNSEKNKGANNYWFGKVGPNQGRIFGEEVRNKMSISKTRELHPLFGKQHSEETKRKMSENRKGKSIKRKQLTCPHCGITGMSSNITRYHFDKCKTYLKSAPPSEPIICVPSLTNTRTSIPDEVRVGLVPPAQITPLKV